MNYPGAKTEENFRPKTRTVKRSGISNIPLRFLWQIQIVKKTQNRASGGFNVNLSTDIAA